MIRLGFGYIAYMTSLAIGAYLFGISEMKEMKDTVQSFNDNLKTKPSRADITTQLNDIICLTYVKQSVEIEINQQWILFFLFKF